MDSQESEDEKLIYPIVLGRKASQEIHEEHNRINYYLSNVFANTTMEKVVGGLDLLIDKPKKKEKKEKKEKGGGEKTAEKDIEKDTEK